MSEKKQQDIICPSCGRSNITVSKDYLSKLSTLKDWCLSCPCGYKQEFKKIITRIIKHNTFGYCEIEISDGYTYPTIKITIKPSTRFTKPVTEIIKDLNGYYNFVVTDNISIELKGKPSNTNCPICGTPAKEFYKTYGGFLTCPNDYHYKVPVQGMMQKILEENGFSVDGFNTSYETLKNDKFVFYIYPSKKIALFTLIFPSTKAVFYADSSDTMVVLNDGLSQEKHQKVLNFLKENFDRHFDIIEKV